MGITAYVGMTVLYRGGPVAQLVERFPSMLEVPVSNTTILLFILCHPKHNWANTEQ